MPLGGTGVTLSWIAPREVPESEISGYRVASSTDYGTTWTELTASTNSTATTYSDTTVEAATTYVYRVAVAGSDAWSASARVTTGGVADLTATPDTFDVRLPSGTLTRNVIRLCWTPAGGTMLSPGKQYEFRVRTSHPIAYAPALASEVGWARWRKAPSQYFHGLAYENPVQSMASCNAGAGIGFLDKRASLLVNVAWSYQMRVCTKTSDTCAPGDTEWLVSGVATATAKDASLPVRTDIVTGGVYEEQLTDLVEPIAADYDDPLTPDNEEGAFIVGIGFTGTSPAWWYYREPAGFDPAEDLEVTNGTAAFISSTHYAHFGYRIRITPTTKGQPVTITVKANAVEVDGRPNPSASVTLQTAAPDAMRRSMSSPEPAAISIGNARAREGVDDAIRFAVIRSGNLTGTTTLDWRTEDGTATVGKDYRAARGGLAFAPGETKKHIDVGVLDDAVDEGNERFYVILGNVSGGTLSRARARGTIVNSDPMPKAWIARLGRTVASQAVDAIGHRMAGGTDSRFMLGGIALDDAGAIPSRDGGEETPGSGAREARTMSDRELLLGSAFRMRTGDGVDAPAWTAWGEFASGGFEADAGRVGLDADVTTGFLGADVARERWLAGLAVSQSRGEGTFELRREGGNDDTGTVESTLTTVYPYARYRVSGHTDAWGFLGFGHGELEIVEHAGTYRRRDVTPKTDIAMRMGAVGVNGRIFTPEESNGFGLTVKSDAFLVRTESAAQRSAGGNLDSARGDAHRVRFVVEGSRSFELGSGATFAPSAEIGVRHDGGDAETGNGVEAGARIRYAAGPLAIEGAVRGLVAHEESGYREWGASGALRIDPGPDGRGLSLTIAPGWGAVSNGVQRLWSARTGANLATGNDIDAGGRLDAEFGYGIGPRDAHGVLTPYAGLSLAAAGNRVYRVGGRWNARPGTALLLEGSHTRGIGTEGTENAAMLRVSVRW